MEIRLFIYVVYARCTDCKMYDLHTILTVWKQYFLFKTLRSQKYVKINSHIPILTIVEEEFAEDSVITREVREMLGTRKLKEVRGR